MDRMKSQIPTEDEVPPEEMTFPSRSPPRGFETVPETIVPSTAGSQHFHAPFPQQNANVGLVHEGCWPLQRTDDEKDADEREEVLETEDRELDLEEVEDCEEPEREEDWEEAEREEEEDCDDPEREEVEDCDDPERELPDVAEDPPPLHVLGHVVFGFQQLQPFPGQQSETSPVPQVGDTPQTTVGSTLEDRKVDVLELTALLELELEHGTTCGLHSDSVPNVSDLPPLPFPPETM